MAFKLDTSKFKKISATKDHTTLQHEDGHQLKIAHAALSPKMRGQIAEIPAMAEGGEVDPTAPPESAQQIAADKQNKARNTARMLPIKPNKMADGGEVADKSWSKKDKGVFSGVFNGGDEPAPKESPAPSSDFGGPTQGRGPKHTPTEYAEGGEIPTELTPEQQDQQDIAKERVQQSGTPTTPVATESPVIPEGNGASGTWDAPKEGDQVAPQEAAIAAQQPAPPAAAPAAAPQAAYDPYGTNAQAGALEKGIAEQKAGLYGEANAAAQQGQQEAAVLQKAQEVQQQAANSYKEHLNVLNDERANFIHDYENGHIDPNHYMNSMGTGQKIATAIGLILGGIGGGSNIANDILQKNIERDIDAQKAELGKKENLLSANLRQFGNLRDATAMTQAMQNDIVSNQLKQAAAKSMDPMAKARALQAAGKIDQDTAGIVGQTTMRRTLLSGAQNGQIPPEKVVNLLVPEAQRAEANKELKEAQGTVAARDNILNAFDQLSKINTFGNYATSPIQNPKQVAAIRDPLLASLSKDTAGKFTDKDAEYLSTLFPAKGDNAQTIQTKRTQMNKLISEKMHFPVLKTYGIDADKMGRFGGSGQSRIPESAPVIKK